MSGFSAERSPIELVTVGFLDPLTDERIEYDFIGREIAGRYTIREHIGGGGMADVFRATDGELGIDVAIKLLKPRLASSDLRARMVQEAQAAAQVRHSNLVRVFGTGAIEGTAFIVMELLPGQNLEQLLRGRPEQRLPCDEALALMLPALGALHAVHERGYIHRDIKTGNILITEDPGGGPPSAVVIDLGLVKPDRALRTVSSPLTTEVGRLLCTPAYISPEQAFGHPVDRRSDVYSMAVTLYRVLAGRLPFHDARAQPAEVVLAHHIYTPPPPLAEAAPAAHIPPAVAAVIESALRKDPAARPQTMRAFAEALAAAGSTSPTRERRKVHPLLLGVALGVACTWLVTPRYPQSAAATAATCPESTATDCAAAACTVSEGVQWSAVSEDAEASSPGLAAQPELADRSSAAGVATGAPHEAGKLIRRRALQARVAALGPKIAACHRDHGGAQALRVKVEVVLERAGQVARVSVLEPAMAPETLCMADALRGLQYAPASGPARIVHAFNLPARSKR